MPDRFPQQGEVIELRRDTQSMTDLEKLQRRIVRCRLCPRLVRWREEVAVKKTKRFASSEYWGKPIPSFGDPHAQVLLVGLAPAAHGGNRTGRMFTGDRSGDWLYRALHKSGFANQPASLGPDDGLRLSNCYVTATCRCAPPHNKLLPAEILACRPFLMKELELLRRVRVIVGLGKVGFDAAASALYEVGLRDKRSALRFSHGAEYRITAHLTLLASFHPSQQNTFTGKLTEPMFDAIFRRARSLLTTSTSHRT
jgi:uracil-DNA glycosylase